MIITKNKHIKTISELTVMHQTQLAEINEIIEDIVLLKLENFVSF